MFNDENKMNGLSLLYESPNIDIIKNWLENHYKSNINISKPDNGIRYILDSNNNQFSSIIIQENKKYKIYG